MTSRTLTWFLLLVLVVILGGITTGLSGLLVSFDRREHSRRHLDQTEDWDRTLLWHLESYLGQFITTENARPYEDYLGPGSNQAFVFDTDLVAYYFHLEPGRTLTHPSPPSPRYLELFTRLQLPLTRGTASSNVSHGFQKVANYEKEFDVDQVLEQNKKLKQQVEVYQQIETQEKDPRQVLGKVDSDRVQDYLFRSQAAENAYRKKNTRAISTEESAFDEESEQSRSKEKASSWSSWAQPFSRGRELSVQDEGVLKSESQAEDSKRESRSGRAFSETKPSPQPMVKEGILKPLIVEQCLVLRRKVQSNGEEHHQGVLIPWAQLQAWAEQQTQNLGRAFTLYPSSQAIRFPSAHQLAMIPAILVTQTPPAPPYHPSMVLRWVLFSFWGAMGISVLILTVLFLGILKLSRRRGMFASAVTHELRTPLTTFAMYTEMLDEGMVQDPEKQKQYLSVLRREADRLSHLVENVLAFSRLEQRKLNLVKEALPLPDFIKTILSRGVELARQKGQPLQLVEPSHPGDWITRCDPDHVGQIVFNLIENAIKYGCVDSNGPIEVTLTLKGKKLFLKVRDHGPGVSPAFRRRLFRPFSKSDRDAADTSHGVGLGLALCRSLARQLGGNLRDIKVQPGACFELSLPIEKK